METPRIRLLVRTGMVLPELAVEMASEVYIDHDGATAVWLDTRRSLLCLALIADRIEDCEVYYKGERLAIEV